VLSNGAIGVELPVVLSKPRDRADPLFAALRSQLLAELGVYASTAPH